MPICSLVELVQELRVVQPGVQLIFAFLLGVAFTNRFPDLPPIPVETFEVALGQRDHRLAVHYDVPRLSWSVPRTGLDRRRGTVRRRPPPAGAVDESGLSFGSPARVQLWAVARETAPPHQSSSRAVQALGQLAEVRETVAKVMGCAPSRTASRG